MKLIMEGWRAFLQEDADDDYAADLKRKRDGDYQQGLDKLDAEKQRRRAARDAELARIKSYAGKSPLEILQMQDDGSPEIEKVKAILAAAEKQKKEALKNLQAQEKAYAAEKEEYAKEAEERVKKHTAMMDKFEAQMQQIAQQSNNPAAAAAAAAQDAKTEKLKQKSAQIEQEFNKRMDAIAAGTRAPEQKGAPVEHFDGDSGQPLTKKGEQICAGNPGCFEKFIKPEVDAGARFSGETGQLMKDLVAIAQQNKG